MAILINLKDRFIEQHVFLHLMWLLSFSGSIQVTNTFIVWHLIIVYSSWHQTKTRILKYFFQYKLCFMENFPFVQFYKLFRGVKLRWSKRNLISKTTHFHHLTSVNPTHLVWVGLNQWFSTWGICHTGEA